MPQFDGTGPQGGGPGTGRGCGPCGYGYHHFWGFHHPRVFRRPSREEALSSLDEEEKYLQEELAALREEKEALKASK